MSKPMMFRAEPHHVEPVFGLVSKVVMGVGFPRAADGASAPDHAPALDLFLDSLPGSKLLLLPFVHAVVALGVAADLTTPVGPRVGLHVVPQVGEPALPGFGVSHTDQYTQAEY